ncbi:hypothetical protein GPL15_05925 [Clostridium sp. MCC353]|uniref:hypothetical protein n=1 Tax=Clostridium sp. MCC353 TaxID=2592646 RepID=UPI001C025489|nr:hypothetical protein [Clostridium sp. MCC353]MBT9776041.1 hypothetical protein [Clostridium sp. MCC353]
MTLITFLAFFALPVSCVASWLSFFIFYRYQLPSKWNTALTIALCLIPMTVLVYINWQEYFYLIRFIFFGK